MIRRPLREYSDFEMTESNVKLVAFDLDGTLLRGNTVLEVLAAGLGRLERMHELESSTAWSDIGAIEQARLEVAGWYQGVALETLLSFLPRAKVAPGVRKGMSLLRSAGVRTAIVSMTWEFAVQWFLDEFGADYCVGTKLTDDGQIVHFWPHSKPAWLAELAHSLGIALGEVAAVGDSGGDIAMLEAVGHPYYVGLSLPPDLPNAVHIPDADMASLAKTILMQGPTA